VIHDDAASTNLCVGLFWRSVTPINIVLSPGNRRQVDCLDVDSKRCATTAAGKKSKARLHDATALGKCEMLRKQQDHSTKQKPQYSLSVIHLSTIGQSIKALFDLTK